MPAAARIGSTTDHANGVLQGSGDVTVMIEKLPAAVAMDPATTLHACGFKVPPPHLLTSPVTAGSMTVFIGKKAAARVNDRAGCGATIVQGASTVFIA